MIAMIIDAHSLMGVLDRTLHWRQLISVPGFVMLLSAIWLLIIDVFWMRIKASVIRFDFDPSGANQRKRSQEQLQEVAHQQRQRRLLG